jgi:triosephosphate isomerase (TIM)
MILLNFKVYKQTWGEGAIKFAKICKKVMEETGTEIIPVVSALDLVRVKEIMDDKKVYLQNIDGNFEGQYTGKIALKQAQMLGADGVVINHSENRLKPGTILQLLKIWPKEMDSIVCIQTLGQTERWAKNISPTFIAYEPSYLIGSSDKSVATEKPEMIKKMVEFYKNIKILAGAGIKSKEDMDVTKKMGGVGVFLASNVIKAEDPEKVLRELADNS